MNSKLVLAGTTVLGAALLVVATPASAAPPSATQTIPITCENGASGVVQVDDRGLPARSAWIDGRGVAARAFSRTESGIVHLVDGTSATYSVDETAGIDAGRNGIHLTPSATSLSSTTACATPAEDFAFTLTLSAEDVAFVGIDASYIGTTAEVVGHGSTTVYLATGQLAART